ncbi:MAG TPA: phosphotransferase family protein [Acidimicrobiales bacterium]|nr:phosphotransferase family protein [Acidimicrobiales bacterium]
MATGATRDDAALQAGLARWVTAHPDVVAALGGLGCRAPVEPGPVVLSHASGGQANETLLVDLGVSHPGMVVRLPPLEPTFPDYDLGPQALVQNAVAASGVPAPAPAVIVSDAEWIGSPFLAMPRVVGDVPGPVPFFDPYVRDAGPSLQRVMHDQLVDAVADIHGVEWETAGLGVALPGPRLRDAVDRWVAYVEWAAEGDPLPALVQALDWCSRHVPPEREAVLLWGDVRMGNLVFDPDRRLTAVLDWDLASLGPREMDLGWYFGLEFMMEALFGGRLPGFPGPTEALERYERRSGYEARYLAWHEVFALVRALAINDRHQRITGEARRQANPMGDILLARLQTASTEAG